MSYIEPNYSGPMCRSVSAQDERIEDQERYEESCREALAEMIRILDHAESSIVALAENYEPGGEPDAVNAALDLVNKARHSLEESL